MNTSHTQRWFNGSTGPRFIMRNSQQTKGARAIPQRGFNSEYWAATLKKQTKYQNSVETGR